MLRGSSTDMQPKSFAKTQIETIEEALQDILTDPTQKSTEFDNVKEEISTLKLGVHSIQDRTEKEEIQRRLKVCETQVASINKTLLMNTRTSQLSSNQHAFYTRLETPEEKQAASLNILKKARQQLAETELVGVSTVTALAEQHSQIKKIKANTEEINDDLKHSNSLLNRMMRCWR